MAGHVYGAAHLLSELLLTVLMPGREVDRQTGGDAADDVAVLKDRGKGARGRRGCALDADATRAGAGAAKERPTTAATAGSRLPEPAHIAIGRDPVSIQLSGSAFCACDCCPR
eukprot:gnl/TRDRNA2_/TRDRNA2_152026_c2_seq1.p2 gnl/TRDRNA2_/TRDRNA2_152026_c2~~gnl/TRDRNA2_/TRDRNA2_152026_c2_seq1.p2  ORF type:complete len:113 (+),score=18.77 gnl/TRDRNA2_/TRDRNA2_152026_c2_seq1:158-496(+)